MKTISVANITVTELDDFFSIKRYSTQTENAIKALFIDGIKQVNLAAILEISPQRINNIKNQFLDDFFDSYEYVRFEAALPISQIKDLKEFQEKCKYFQVKTKLLTPSRRSFNDVEKSF